MLKSNELDINYELLKQHVLKLTSKTGRFTTAIDGFMVTRREEQNELGNFFYKPMIGITLQGKKCSTIANQTYHYGEGNCVIASVVASLINLALIVYCLKRMLISINCL